MNRKRFWEFFCNVEIEQILAALLINLTEPVTLMV